MLFLWKLIFNYKQFVLAGIFVSLALFVSCQKDDFVSLDLIPEEIEDLSVTYTPYGNWETTDRIIIKQFSPLNFLHQSAAAYGDYALFVTGGRSRICLYNLKTKEVLYTLDQKGVSSSTYHCNQSTFGIEKYAQDDPFPLLYISQRAKSDKRCFIEVYRIAPEFNVKTSDYDSFSIEKVQTILLPKMSYDNSLGNANCVIDSSNGLMYTYSRNNNSTEDNYGQCKITCFSIPMINEKTVVLEDSDILSSFMTDIQAINMQGGCIKDGILYIGQGSAAAGYIYLNIIDLQKELLVRRFNLRDYKINWEPEGCFFYNGSVMLAHSSAICRIDK